jgi:hypothetical protein
MIRGDVIDPKLTLDNLEITCGFTTDTSIARGADLAQQSVLAAVYTPTATERVQVQRTPRVPADFRDRRRARIVARGHRDRLKWARGDVGLPLSTRTRRVWRPLGAVRSGNAFSMR